MKKLISLILTAVMLFGAVGAAQTAFAAEGAVTVEKEYTASPEGIYTTAHLLAQYTDLSELRAFLYESVSRCDEKTDLSVFNLPYSLVKSLIEYVYYAMPEAFHVKNAAYYNHGDGRIHEVTFSYKSFCDTPQEFEAYRSQLESAADKILSGIEGNSKLTDVQKALLLHDRLALTTEYAFGTTSTDDFQHTAYGALVKGSAVCQGYAMAYLYLLERVGIECYYCASSQLNHGWNIVYIDGVPYHVDVTWDDRNYGDSRTDFTGRTDHNYFLLSTAGLKAEGHNATDFNTAPKDTRYDNYFWRNSTTAFVLLSDDIYYIDNKAQTLNRYSDRKVLESVEDVWYADGSHVWGSNFSCLSSAGADLFYSKTDGIYKYTPSEERYEKIYSPELSGVYAVYGFAYEDGELLIDINTSPNSTQKLRRISEPYTDVTLLLEGIEIESPPEKTVYYIGEAFDSTGIAVNGIYSGYTEIPLTDGLVFSGFSSDTAGEKTVRVAYGDFWTEFTVTVKMPVPDIAEGDSIKLRGDRIIVSSGVTAAQLLTESHPEVEIRFPDSASSDGTEALVTGTLVLFPDETLTVIVAGDTDCDGLVTASDARFVLRASVGLEIIDEASFIFRAANVMTEDSLSAADARAILRASVGLDSLSL